VLQGKDSNYDTDQFTPLLTGIGEISDRRYGGTNERPMSRCASSPTTSAR